MYFFFKIRYLFLLLLIKTHVHSFQYSLLHGGNMWMVAGLVGLVSYFDSFAFRCQMLIFTSDNPCFLALQRTLLLGSNMVVELKRIVEALWIDFLFVFQNISFFVGQHDGEQASENNLESHIFMKIIFLYLIIFLQSRSLQQISFYLVKFEFIWLHTTLDYTFDKYQLQYLCDFHIWVEAPVPPNKCHGDKINKTVCNISSFELNY